MIEKVVFLLVASIGLIGGLALSNSYHKQNDDRCEAAQQTILDEAELIAAGGKFPGEQVTDRWKKLLGGCQ